MMVGLGFVPRQPSYRAHGVHRAPQRHASLKEVSGKSWPMWRITESHDGAAGKGLQGLEYFLLILQMGRLRPRGR